MSTWNDTKNFVIDQLRPGVSNGTSVQKLQNSILAVINQAAAGDIEVQNQNQWNPETVYPKDVAPVLYNDQWLVSNIADNVGILPINESGQVHGAWRIVSASSGNLQPWEPKIYINKLEVVDKDDKFYKLNRTLVGDGPFSSVDFAAELAEEKWVIYSDKIYPVLSNDTDYFVSFGRERVYSLMSTLGTVEFYYEAPGLRTRFNHNLLSYAGVKAGVVYNLYLVQSGTVTKTSTTTTDPVVLATNAYKYFFTGFIDYTVPYCIVIPTQPVLEAMSGFATGTFEIETFDTGDETTGINLLFGKEAIDYVENLGQTFGTPTSFGW